MASGYALVFSLALIGWAAFMRALCGTWLQPGAFFSLWWCFAGILPLVLAPNEPVGPNAILWLIAACVAVGAGAIVGNRGTRTRLLALSAPATGNELRIFGFVLLISVILGFGSTVVFMVSSSIPLSNVLDIEKLVIVSNQVYVQRSIEGAANAPPVLAQALLPFVYLAPAVGGILFELRREKRWKLFALASFIPGIAVTVLQTTKAALLFTIVLWLSGYFATRLRSGKLSVFTKGHVVTGVLIGGIITVFFFAVSLARLASTDVSLLNVVMLKLVTAAFGHMTVFSQWLAEYWSQSTEPTLGTVTFAGPLELLGYGHRIAGLFDSMVDLVAGDTSNIYTAFRPLIQDFTVPGALAILALLGFAGGVGFRHVAAGQWSSLPLLLIAYATIFWTPITWLWIYNSLTATLLAVGLILFLIRLWRGLRAAQLTRERIVSPT